MPNQQLITHARGHVTGEYAQNTVYLTGERVSDAGFYQNIRLSVQPSIGSAETCIRPAEDSGYNPQSKFCFPSLQAAAALLAITAFTAMKTARCAH